MQSIRIHALPLALLTLPVLVYHYKILFMAGVICGGDFINQFVPWRQFALAELGEGRFPGWNPYVFCGAPFAANIQTSLYYPWNLMHLFFDTERMFSLSLVVHHALAAVLMYGFLFHRIRLAAAATLGALVYVWSGFLITHAHDGHLIHARAYAWIPLALWCQTVWMHHNRGWAFWGMTGSLALMFYGGHTQIPLYVFYVLFARALWTSLGQWSAGASWKSVVAPSLKTLAALGAAVGLSLLVLLPLADLSLHTAGRAGGADYDFATNDSMPPSFLPTFIAPFFWGNPTAGLRESRFWITTTGYHELCGYVGVLTLVLLPFAFLHLRKPDTPVWKSFLQSETLYFASLVFFGLFFALGEYNPLYPLLYYGLPGWSYFRVPARLVLVFILGASFVSAMGLAHWLRTPWNDLQHSWATKTSVIASLIVVFSSITVWMSKPAVTEWMRALEVERTIQATQAWTASRSMIAQQLPDYLFDYRFAEMISSLSLASLLLVFGWAALVLARRVSSPWSGYAPVLILLLDLMLFSRHFITVLPVQEWRQTYYPDSAIVEFLRTEAPEARILEMDTAIGHPGLQYHPELRPNRLMGYGLRSARGYDPIILNTYATSVNRLYGREDNFPQGGLLFFSEPPDPQRFSHFATEYLISAFPLPEPYEEVWRDEESNVRVFRFSEAKPTFFLEHPSGGEIHHQNTQVSPQRMRIPVTVSGSNVLHASIPFHPNWKAYSGGIQVPIEPRQGNWLAIPLDEGDSEIELKFIPSGTITGMYLSSFILTALLSVHIYLRLTRKMM